MEQKEYIQLPIGIAEQVNKMLNNKDINKCSKEQNFFAHSELSAIEELDLYSIEQIEILQYFPNVKTLRIKNNNINKVFYPLKENTWERFVKLVQNIEYLEIENLFGLKEFDCNKFGALKNLKLINCLNLKDVKNHEKLDALQLVGNDNLQLDPAVIADKIIQNYKQGKECKCDCDVGLSYQLFEKFESAYKDDMNFLFYLIKNVSFKQPMYNGDFVEYSIMDVEALVGKTKEIVKDINTLDATPMQKMFNAIVWMNKNVNIDYMNSPDMFDKKTMRYINRKSYMENLNGEYMYAENGVFGAIIYGRTICEGSARAFAYILRACGVQTSFILSHIYNKDFYSQKQKNDRVNENVPATHVMSVVRLDADTVTIVDSVGAVRDLDTKLVDNYNIGYSFNDLDKNNVIVRFCDCGEYKKCKVLTLKEVLSCTKKAYESVYKEKDPAKLKKMVLDKNTAKRQYKNKRLKEKEVILAKEDAIIALSLLEQ